MATGSDIIAIERTRRPLQLHMHARAISRLFSDDSDTARPIRIRISSGRAVNIECKCLNDVKEKSFIGWYVNWHSMTWHLVDTSMFLVVHPSCPAHIAITLHECHNRQSTRCEQCPCGPAHIVISLHYMSHRITFSIPLPEFYVRICYLKHHIHSYEIASNPSISVRLTL
jgi:hypothetical protein